MSSFWMIIYDIAFLIILLIVYQSLRFHAHFQFIILFFLLELAKTIEEVKAILNFLYAQLRRMQVPFDHFRLNQLKSLLFLEETHEKRLMLL